MEMSSNLKIVKKNVKEAWTKYHQIKALKLKTPNEILVKMTSPILNELSYVVDFGSGSLNNSVWFAKNGIETLSIDYAFLTVLDLVDYGECPFKFVDTSKFLSTKGMCNYLADEGYEVQNYHYSTEAHEAWANFVKISLVFIIF